MMNKYFISFMYNVKGTESFKPAHLFTTIDGMMTEDKLRDITFKLEEQRGGAKVVITFFTPIFS